MPEKRQNIIKFSAILDTLKDLSRPFSPVYLHQFSDLSPAYASQLRQAWADVTPERRRALLSDLEDLADSDTLMSFTEVGRVGLDDLDPLVRTLALRLLWEAEEPHLIPIIIRLLENDPDPSVRATAANGLGAYVYLGEIEDLPHDLLEKIETALFTAYHGTDQAVVRRRALESLGYSSRPEVTGLIEEAYRLGAPDWLESALFAIGRSADQSWGPEILKHLDHGNPNVQYEAVRSAGELQLAGARQPLIDFLEESEDDTVRTAAIWSLSQIGGDGVRPALESLLEQTEDDEEIDIIEEALDNLSFTEDMAIFDLFDLDMGDDAGTIIDLDSPTSLDEEDMNSKKNNED
jgi:HEAT repeat protein